MRVIISDTSPIRYLVLIGEQNLLPRLYGRILLPEAVRAELQQPHTPEVVRTWMDSAPKWMEVVHASEMSGTPISSSLGAGERQAISLAIDAGADLLLVDDRAAVREARRLGLVVTGTLGILVRAAELGFVDLRSALQRLGRTNFRVDPKILRQLGS